MLKYSGSVEVHSPLRLTRSWLATRRCAQLGAGVADPEVGIGGEVAVDRDACGHGTLPSLVGVLRRKHGPSAARSVGSARHGHYMRGRRIRRDADPMARR